MSQQIILKGKRFRELFEKEIEGKNKEPGTNICPTPYKACREDTDLQILFAIGWVPVQAIQEITKEHLIKSVKSRCLKTKSGENLFTIDAAVSKVEMKMKILEAGDGVWSLHRDYIKELRNSRCGGCTMSKPHIAIKHIMERLKPQQQKTRIRDIIRWRKINHFD